jgi:hypothetical protein
MIMDVRLLLRLIYERQIVSVTLSLPHALYSFEKKILVEHNMIHL